MIRGINQNRLNVTLFHFLASTFCHRSLCSVVCKCNYEHTTRHSGWNKEFFDSIGLTELSKNNWKKIGR